MRPQKLQIGIENFKELRKQDYYYMAQTDMLVALISDRGKIN